MKTLTIILTFLLSCPGFSCDNVTKVAKGNPAPCNGWHVSDPQMQDFRKQTDQLQIQKDIHKVNEQLIKLSETEINFYKSRVKSQAKELDKAESKRFWTQAGAFVLGVVLTGVAAKAAIEATK